MEHVQRGIGRKLGIVAALVAATMVTVVGQGTAHASVTSVTGSAFGFYTNVGLFGGPQEVRGPAPTVTLPSAGGSLRVTDPDGDVAIYGPARIFENTGPLTVSTRGTTGATGSVTSFATVDDIEPNDPFTAPSPNGQVKSTCTASETGLTGSTQITGGRLVLKDPNADIYGEPGEIVVTPPAFPAPGLEYRGEVANVNDYFTIVFNEQIRTPDSITVNAVHMYLEGPVAVGDMIIAQSVCGVAGTTANQAPVANDDTFATGVGQTKTFSAPGVLGNDTDPEGLPLVASKIPPTAPPTTGTSCDPYPTRCAVWLSPSNPANGTLALNFDGSFTYTPNPGFAGIDTFVYTASDKRGMSDTATVSIVVGDTYVSVGDAWVAEGDSGTTTANFTVTRYGNTAGTSTMTYQTSNGTAVAPGDYTALPLTTLTFANGETSKVVQVPVVGDTAGEAAETFNLVLTSPVGAIRSDATGVGTILNDDPGTYLSINDAVVTEGNAGTVMANFTITRSGETSGSSTVKYATANGTALVGLDYTMVSLTSVTFLPGETTKAVSVPVNGDILDEANETFTVNLSAPVGAVIADTAGTATIVDDEGTVTPGPTTFFSVNDTAVIEGDAGTTPVTFTVTRSGNTAGASSVKYASLNGSATTPSDYTAVPLTTLNFAAGETTKTVTFDVIGDTVSEFPETLRVVLSAPVGGVLSDNIGIATIVNDDLAALSVGDVTVIEGTGGTVTADFTITRAGATAGATTVSYKTTNGTAASGSDYTAVPLTSVTFVAGETTKTVSVTITTDAVDEPNETFTVNLSGAVAGTIVDTAGVATVVDDD
ncbi:MAG: Calx-beta domain-containing protein [Acidimicrobiales bacterium]